MKETRNDPDAHPVKHMPGQIWLVLGDGIKDDDSIEWTELTEVTWCEDKQFDSDVAYVRAALVAPLPTGRGRDDAIAQAVLQCIDFGRNGVSKPPDGHWLNEFWAYGAALVAPLPSDAPSELIENESDPVALWAEIDRLRAATAPAEPTELPDEFERGRQQGMKQEHALWELTRNSEEIEALKAAGAVLK